MPASTEPVYGIEYYGDTVRRHWRIVVIGAIVGTMMAGIYLAARPPGVTATSDVSISAASTNPFESSTNALDPTTETQLVMSQPVAASVAKSVPGVTPADVRRGVTVDAVSDTAIVHISFDGRTAEQARSVADALAQGYIDYRAERSSAKLVAALGAIDDRVAELETLVAQIKPNDDSPAAAAKRASVDRELGGLATQRAQFAQVDVTGGTLVTSAEYNATDLTPNPFITLLAGLLAGGVIGMIAAFPARAAQRRWQTAGDVERSTDAAVLATVTETEAALPEIGASAEVFFEARERILSRLPGMARSIAVIDDSAPGSSDAPANLAAALARAGTSVDLIIAGADDETRAELTAHLAATDTHSSRVDGLTVQFATNDSFSALVRSEPQHEVRVIALLAEAPPSLVLAALRVSEAAVLIGTLGVTTSETGRRVAQQAREFDAVLLGTVLVPSGRVLGSPPAAPPAAPSVAPPARAAGQARSKAARAARQPATTTPPTS